MSFVAGPVVPGCVGVKSKSLSLGKLEALEEMSKVELLDSDIEIMILEEDTPEKKDSLDEEHYNYVEQDEADARGGPKRQGRKRTGRPPPTNPLQAIASKIVSLFAPLLRPGGGAGGVLSRDSPSPPSYGAHKKPRYRHKPSYGAPKPAYIPRKRPSYHHRKASYHQPEPSYQAPAAPSYEEPVKEEVDDYGSPQAPASPSFDAPKKEEKDEYGSQGAPASSYTEFEKEDEQYNSPQAPVASYSEPGKKRMFSLQCSYSFLQHSQILLPYPSLQI